MTFSKIWFVVVVYFLAALVGLLGSWLQVPLAWVLGPLVVVGGVSMSGAHVPASKWLRRIGQITIGATVGLAFTHSVLMQVLSWLPAIMGTALVSIILSAVYCVVLAKLGDLDLRTAYFANLPGGLAEMSNVGTTLGARADAIMVVQTIRVTLVVLLLPPLIAAAGLSGMGIEEHSHRSLSLPLVAGLILACFVGALLVGLLRLNNPWPVGAILVSGGLTATGILDGSMPYLAFGAAQFVIGVALGTRLRREIISRLPRVAMSGVFGVILFGGTLAAYAIALASVTGLDVAVAVLGSSAGGMAEMVATAHALGISAPLVVGFHVARNVLVNGFATHFLWVFERSGFFPYLDRLIR